MRDGEGRGVRAAARHGGEGGRGGEGRRGEREGANQLAGPRLPTREQGPSLHFISLKGVLEFGAQSAGKLGIRHVTYDTAKAFRISAAACWDPEMRRLTTHWFAPSILLINSRSLRPDPGWRFVFHVQDHVAWGRDRDSLFFLFFLFLASSWWLGRTVRLYRTPRPPGPSSLLPCAPHPPGPRGSQQPQQRRRNESWMPSEHGRRGKCTPKLLSGAGWVPAGSRGSRAAHIPRGPSARRTCRSRLTVRVRGTRQQ